MSPNGLYIAIVGATVIGYGLVDPNRKGEILNPILLAAILGGIVGGLTGNAWRGAAIGSGVALFGYQIYNTSAAQPAALPAKGA
jgi:hypothetical protein